MPITPKYATIHINEFVRRDIRRDVGGCSPRPVGVVHDPVAQVKAPSIFNRYFADAGHDAVFVGLDLEPGHLAGYFDTMRHTANFRGGFVTVPHKQEAANCMDEMTERARTLDAVNVVKRVDRTLIGDMTDGAAFVEASRGRGLEPAGARVAMVGGGAAATAIAHAFADAGVAELVMNVRRESRHDPLRRVVESGRCRCTPTIAPFPTSMLSWSRCRTRFTPRSQLISPKRGVHLLVEKPIADPVASGRSLCDAAAACGVHSSSPPPPHRRGTSRRGGRDDRLDGVAIVFVHDGANFDRSGDRSTC